MWNNSFRHFIDRFKVDNQYVHYWDFIRGREPAGLIPWYFNLSDDKSVYNAAWKHITDTTELLGKFGLRTNEPSYQYYFKQFVFYKGQRGSQWNGPSLPYQTSQVLTGMANLINDYHQTIVTASDYIKILRPFAMQHFLPNGKTYLVENYDPNVGGPIVYYCWSNHYNHSSFNNLVITGLCGIRPSAGDTVVINPIVDSSIHYFCLDDVLYHGHKLTVVYDKDGTTYKTGKGLSVYVDGRKKMLIQKDGKPAVNIGKPVLIHSSKEPVNYALNILYKGFPKLSTSVNFSPDTSLYQAIDERIWYFSAITNRWTTYGSKSHNDWYALDFGQTREISTLKLYLYTDNKFFFVPGNVTIQYKNNGEWTNVKLKPPAGKRLVGNTVNSINFNEIVCREIKIIFKHGKQIAISEIECY